jgi:hypothetical protein
MRPILQSINYELLVGSYVEIYFYKCVKHPSYNFLARVGIFSYSRSYVIAKTAKTRNNYIPCLVFYLKKRLLFTQNRFFTIKNEKCPALVRRPPTIVFTPLAHQ